MAGILILDNFDSFTFNLADYFQRCGVQTRIVRNNIAASELPLDGMDGLVLSPGPETPEKAGCLLESIKLNAGRIPILGICLGHQAIGQYYGARLVKAPQPMHGKLSEIETDVNDPNFKDLPPRFNVVRYHSLILEDLPDCLWATAHTAKGEVMAIRHKHLGISGFQFHPEAILTEYGLQLLGNWLRFHNIAT
jgi:anthranilate synthase/aminodeoxychorismate synthase-like glutamine amidotransferase